MRKIIEILQARNILAAFLILGAIASFGCSMQKTAATETGSGNKTAIKASGDNQTAEANKNIQQPQASPTVDKNLEAEYRQRTNEYYGEVPMPQSPVKDDAKIISKASFDKIAEGMSYKEVVKAMGDEGMLVSIMKVNGRETQIYKWSNADFSKYIDVTFEKEKVVEKKQKGLS
jgi:hypothetical protein